jgi:two-component system, sporulation sensor kinase E
MNGSRRFYSKANASANVSRSRSRRDKYTRLFAERFLDNDSHGVLILDSEFRIVEIGEMICKICGLDKIHWLNRPVEEWFEESGFLPYPFDKSLLDGRIFRDRTLEWGNGEGRRTVMLEGDVLRDTSTGDAAGAFVLIRDVSNLRLLEEQVRRSDRLKTIGQIAAGTAHEIRNPLTAIRGFMQLLNNSVTDRGMVKEQEFVTIMMSELDRVNELVSEFLLLSKPKEVRFSPITSGFVLQEILPVIRSEALLHAVNVHYEPMIGLPSVWVDKEQLKQVFLNLGKNAIEAMIGGGSLVFREFRSPDHPDQMAVSVGDTGPGISPEVLERIFDPFFTTKPQGTGLGLSICQRIIHDLGGQLEVASGKDGTTFTVWLPLASSAPEYS